MIKNYQQFINESLNDKFATYDFDKKIVKNKENALQNALNIKEVIHSACNWCLDNSGLIFMFEIAIVETGLGTSSKSNATTGDIGRGIFHVDEGTFKWTQEKHSRINLALQNLKKKGLDWSTVEWNDVSKNILIAAIACKLVLLKKGINKSTDLSTMDKRSKIYAKYYNGGGTAEAQSNFIKNVKGWLSHLKDKGAEYFNFNNKKFIVSDTGLTK